MSEPNPILETENLEKRYGDYKALDRVSVAIPRGSVFGLLGPNGAGKTSLIRILTQITAPDSGHVRFEGQPLAPEHIRRIGYLPEERGLYKKAPVGEQLVYLAQLKGMTRGEALEKTKSWFSRLDIREWWGKNVEELSKGMAQKVQFVATVIHEPSFLILDEPFSGFDPVNSDVIRDEILRLHREGATILFSTHRMDTVEELCSHVVLIDHARKILDGPTRQIRQDFKSHRYRVTTAEPIHFETFPWEPEERNRPTETGFTSAFRLLEGQSPNELVSDVLRTSSLVAFSEELPSFHDIFVQAVGRNRSQHA
jgi:ABC-2 type transport system ATP-binding protein